MNTFKSLLDEYQPITHNIPEIQAAPQDPSILEKILTYTPVVNAFYLASKEIADSQRVKANAPRNATYQQYADYYAPFDPDRAAKYAELAQAQQPKQYGQTVTLEDGNVYQLTTGAPVSLGKAPPAAPKFGIDGGYITQNGMPISELPMTARQKAEQQRSEAAFNLSLAAAKRAEEAAKRTEGQIEYQRQKDAEQAKFDPNRRKFNTAINRLNSGIQMANELEQLVKSASPTELLNPRNPISAKAGTLATNLQDVYRSPEFADLGVVNAADVPRIDQILPNPTSPINLLKGKDAMLEKIRSFRQQLQGGYQSLGVEQQQKPKVKRYNPATGRIE